MADCKLLLLATATIILVLTIPGLDGLEDCVLPKCEKDCEKAYSDKKEVKPGATGACMAFGEETSGCYCIYVNLAAIKKQETVKQLYKTNNAYEEYPDAVCKAETCTSNCKRQFSNGGGGSGDEATHGECHKVKEELDDDDDIVFESKDEDPRQRKESGEGEERDVESEESRSEYVCHCKVHFADGKSGEFVRENYGFDDHLAEETA